MSSSYNECRRGYHMPQQAEMGTIAIGSKLSVPFMPHTIFDLNLIGGFLGISFSIRFLTSQVPMGFESLLSLIIYAHLFLNGLWWVFYNPVWPFKLAKQLKLWSNCPFTAVEVSGQQYSQRVLVVSCYILTVPMLWWYHAGEPLYHCRTAPFGSGHLTHSALAQDRVTLAVTGLFPPPVCGDFNTGT